MPKSAIALFENNSYFLDHLIPYSYFFTIPILTHEIATLIEIETFYPELPLFLTENIEGYEKIFYGSPYKCYPNGLHFPLFFTSQKVTSYCTYHGVSEKYLDEFWWERLVDEDVVLLPGQFIIDLLRTKGIYERLQRVILTGNVRLRFYEKERVFFKKKIAPFLPKEKAERTLLWAPTWNIEDPLAFFRQAECFIPQIPLGWHLLVKLHPLLFERYPTLCAEFEEKYPSLFFIKNVPLIYPLLEAADFFLSDGSSIAYDFLAFNRPLFFLEERGKMIHQGGRVIHPDEYGKLFQIMDQKESPELSEKRHELYHYFFADVSLEELKL